MNGIFEKSVKTKHAAIKIHRLLQCAWDNTKFSGSQTFEINYNSWHCRWFEWYRRKCSLCVWHSVSRLSAVSVCCSQIASLLWKMVNSLEQRIFLVMQFHHLEHSVVATRRSFQRKFNVTKEPKNKTRKYLFEKFQWIGNVKDKRSGNVGLPGTAIIDGNDQLLHQMIQQWPQLMIYIQR